MAMAAPRAAQSGFRHAVSAFARRALVVTKTTADAPVEPFSHAARPQLSNDGALDALNSNPWFLDESSSFSMPEPVDLSTRAQVVFLGLPGVGKGTYASRLAKVLGVPHIAMGDLVRDELKSGTTLASQMEAVIRQGQLLSDEVVMDLLSRRLEYGASHGEAGFILDGFPRKGTQAETLSNMADIDLVLNLRLQEDVLVTKCMGRRICGQCGENFNVADINVESTSGDGLKIIMPPLLPPTQCASKMTQRIDDTEEVIRTRLRVHQAECKPVENYYRRKGLLVDFEVAGGIQETWPRLLEALHLDGMAEEESRAA